MRRIPYPARHADPSQNYADLLLPAEADGGHARVRLLPGQTHTSMIRAKSATYLDLLQTIVDAAIVR